MSIIKFDFTQPGKFPLTQDRLADMQNAYFTAITQIGFGLLYGKLNPNPLNIPVAHIPVLLSGMAVLEDGSYSEGYFFYNGDVIYFPAQIPPVAPPHQAVYVQINTITLSLIYGNGESGNVVLVKQGFFVLDGSPDLPKDYNTENKFVFTTMINGWNG